MTTEILAIAVRPGAPYLTHMKAYRVTAEGKGLFQIAGDEGCEVIGGWGWCAHMRPKGYWIRIEREIRG